MWCVPRCGNNNHIKHLRDRIETMSTPTDQYDGKYSRGPAETLTLTTNALFEQC